MFERGAGRNYLLENPPQMVPAERPGIVRDYPVEHLPFAHRLIDRRTVVMLELADLLGEARALIKQRDQLQIDFVDPLAQVIERRAAFSAAEFFPGRHRGAKG
jgi:hypothetical protein